MFKYCIFLNYYYIYNDAPRPWQIGFQDSATPIMEGITELHDEILFYLIIILLFISWLLITIIFQFSANRNSLRFKYENHGTILELIWTIAPAFILVAIALPSFNLLYLMDEISSPELTIKAIGRQWYWSYEYSDYLNNDSEGVSFDSYMVPTSDLEIGQLRLLEVDNRVMVPINTQIRILTTASDVIHCFSVPSLGIKMDSMPGRLNQTAIYIAREGIFYGQCQELCGTYHAQMPIVIESVSLEKYLGWLNEQLNNSPPRPIKNGAGGGLLNFYLKFLRT